MNPITLTLAHSPDPDDAFMWWPLGDTGAFTGAPREPSIDVGRFRFTSIPADIHELNVRAVEKGDLDITAVSMYAYAHAAERYMLLSCGSSMGDGYGPKFVALPEVEARFKNGGWRDDDVVAVPGERTSAFLALRLMHGRAFRFQVMRFDLIAQAVAEGRFAAGIVIHESQLTYESFGLRLLADLGAWWKDETGLPMPLGANVIRADTDARFGPGTAKAVAGLLKRSIEHALANRVQGLAVARASAVADHAHATTDPEQTDRFVRMYVNDLTLDLGGQGGRGLLGVEAFLMRAVDAGLLPAFGGVRVVSP